MSQLVEGRLGVIRRERLLQHRASDPVKEVIRLFCFLALFSDFSSTLIGVVITQGLYSNLIHYS